MEVKLNYNNGIRNNLCMKIVFLAVEGPRFVWRMKWVKGSESEECEEWEGGKAEMWGRWSLNIYKGVVVGGLRLYWINIITFAKVNKCDLSLKWKFQNTPPSMLYLSTSFHLSNRRSGVMGPPLITPCAIVSKEMQSTVRPFLCRP